MKYYDFIVCGELKSKEEWRNELPEWKKIYAANDSDFV